MSVKEGRRRFFNFTRVSVVDWTASPYYRKSFRFVEGRSGKARDRDCCLPAVADPAVVAAAAVDIVENAAVAAGVVVANVAAAAVYEL